MIGSTYTKIIIIHTGCPPHTKKNKNNTDTNLTFLYTLYCVLVHNYLINNLHIYQTYMWILMSFLLVYQFIIIEIAPNIGQTFSIVLGGNPLCMCMGQATYL